MNKQRGPLGPQYQISVQRRESAGGRWREIASWTVISQEEDMLGPLNCGLRPNYRILVRSGRSAEGHPVEEEGDPA